ncbi:hypothetical protein FJTKL_07281 [Diaporthe vaccinii]|uniref:Uncharacterized protein n=1 Tax=Diaporthe vaccinii TaxID=105482 RepID=A0ABR4EUC1_9PEZI
MEKQQENVRIAASSADAALAKVPDQRTELPLAPEQSAEKTTPPSALFSKLRHLNGRLEARGIDRVPPDERQPPSTAGDVQIALLWFSANISCNNLIVGLYGSMLFQLGSLDSAMCAIFGAFLGSLSTAFMAIWGPKSGHRTMVVLRYFFGWWPAKLPTVLNIVLMIGYCCIDGILGGQILSAVSGGTVSIAVGT